MGKHGPNVTKLIIKITAYEAIPSGGGFADGVEFISNPERRRQVLESAEMKVIKLIQIIKSLPDNPFGDDDEQIAFGFLKKLELIKQQRKRFVKQ